MRTPFDLPPPLAFIDDKSADDVCLEADEGRLWLAWSATTRENERVRFALLADGSARVFDLADAAADLFRPAITRFGDGIAWASCSASGPLCGGLASATGPRQCWTIETSGVCVHVSLATGAGDQVLLAWEERLPGSSRVRGGWLDPRSGQLEPIRLPEQEGALRRWPAVASDGSQSWLAYVDSTTPGEDRIKLVDIERSDREIVVESAASTHDAPTVAIGARSVAVAWHSCLGEDGVETDVPHWLRCAVVDRVTGAPRSSTGFVSREIPRRRDQAGEDQGWEFPSLACTRDALWLAGRSSNGYHLAVGHETGDWSTRAALSNDTWSGRGRRSALCAVGERVLFARREPAGIAVSELPPPLLAVRDVAAQPQSAPAVRSPPSPRPQWARDILFGDLHQHSIHSDGCGSYEELFVRARRHRGLDFAAVTDHDSFCRRAIGPATWRYMCEVSNWFNRPGEFVTFPAYEFTGSRAPGPGHKCIYFEDRVPDRIPDKDLPTLFAMLKELGAIAIPHHVGWTGADKEHHDAYLQPVWEICSVHGAYEQHGAESPLPPRGDRILPGNFVADALGEGLRFGFIGGTDSHGLLWHHGLSPKRDPFQTGLAGIARSDRQRSSIFDAIRARRTFATTGARILLDVELDGAPMGSELPADAAGSLGVRVRGSAPLRSVDIVRRRQAISVDGASGCELDATVPVRASGEANDYLYVRVTQEDGEMAWASPIWFGGEAR